MHSKQPKEMSMDTLPSSRLVIIVTNFRKRGNQSWRAKYVYCFWNNGHVYGSFIFQVVNMTLKPRSFRHTHGMHCSVSEKTSRWPYKRCQVSPRKGPSLLRFSSAWQPCKTCTHARVYRADYGNGPISLSSLSWREMHVCQHLCPLANKDPKR